MYAFNIKKKFGKSELKPTLFSKLSRIAYHYFKGNKTYWLDHSLVLVIIHCVLISMWVFLLFLIELQSGLANMFVP